MFGARYCFFSLDVDGGAVRFLGASCFRSNVRTATILRLNAEKSEFGWRRRRSLFVLVHRLREFPERNDDRLAVSVASRTLSIRQVQDAPQANGDESGILTGLDIVKLY